MKLIVAALFALLAVSASSAPLEDYFDNVDWSKVAPVVELPGFWEGRDLQPVYHSNDQSRSGRIVGGVEATRHAHPYQVALLINRGNSTTGLCGGVIIGSGVVLTAAHCIVGSLGTQVIAGAHQITTLEPTQHRAVVFPTGYRIHGNFDPLTFNNNIATLVLPGLGIPLNAQRGMIPLAPANSGDFSGQTGTVSGWGRTSDGSMATSPVLRSVLNIIIPNEQCFASYAGLVIPSTICTSTAGGQGTCGGDAGGPLTVAPETGTGRLLVGISSFGAARGCQYNFPAAFSRISSFIGWIDANRT